MHLATKNTDKNALGYSINLMGINNSRILVATILLILCLIVFPFFLEFYTFHLYLAQEKAFFAFSGARLWFFLTFEVMIGFALGRIAAYRNLPTITLGSAFAIFVLMTLLCQFCDLKQCYDPGPHNLGPVKLWVLLLGVTSTGVLAGMISRGSVPDDKIRAHKISLALGLFFSAMTCIGMAYYPLSMLYGTGQESSISVAFIIYSATVPVFFSRLILSLFSNNKKYKVAIAVASLFATSVLFIDLENAGLLFAVLAIGTAMSAAASRFSYINANFTISCRSKLIIMPTIAATFVSASHPFIDASINLDEGLKS